MLFGLSATFAQGVWTLNVSWNDSECDNCSNGYFEVVYTIYDNFNEVEIYTNAVETNIALTENDVDIEVPLVEDNCELEDETYRPNYEIHVAVYMYCYYGIEPTVICSGTGNVNNKTCYDFNNGIVYVSVGNLTPVE